VPGQHEDGGADTKTRGARRQEGQQRQRRRELADAGEVMLGHEARIKAKRLGLDIGLDEIEETFARSTPDRAIAAEAPRTIPNRMGVPQ